MSNKLNFLLRAKHLKKNPPTIDEEIQNIIHNNNHPGGTLINQAEKLCSSGTIINLANDILINQAEKLCPNNIIYEEDSDPQTSDDEQNSTVESFNKVKNLVKFYNNLTTKTNKKGLDYFSGPYEYKICFENKEYPHSVNINKLIFNYKIGKTNYSKILYLSTGHSFAEPFYLTDQGIKIEKVNQINKVFEETDKNIFYSLDDGFNDFALISFDLTLNNNNKLKFNDKLYNVKSVCKNMDIKFLENETFLKNGNNIGETYTRSLINFDTDRYIKSNDFFTFKINGTIVIIKTKFTCGIVLKGISSNISKFNGLPISEEKNMNNLNIIFQMLLKTYQNMKYFLI